MNKKVSAERFCNVFRELWNIEKVNNPKGILCSYSKDLFWTDFMLGGKALYECAFLFRVSEKLSLEMSKGWYTIDCVYYEEEPNLIRRGTYPACLDVFIEHENQEKVEEEMWKMLMFRSPLKVLIFYDYHEYEKVNSKAKQKWLQNKLNKLFNMGQEVDATWPEADNTEYLFLVGNRDKEGELPRWRYLIVKSGDFSKVRYPASLDLL